MRRATWFFLAAIPLFLGCTRPEVEAFRQHPAPVAVHILLPPQLDNREDLRQEYVAALQARLATRVVVVPEGVKPPVGAADLQVVVQDISVASAPSSAASVGLATGLAVGALSAVAGNRGYSVFDGLFWGLWAGSHAAAHQDRAEARLDRLGYRPQAVRAQLRLMRAGDPEPLWTDYVDPREVVEAMDPLPLGYRDDDGRIREEEARGFARVVVQKLSAYFQWTRFTEQRFYEDPAAPRREPPAPRPPLPLTMEPPPPPQIVPPPPPAVLPPPPPPTEPPASAPKD